MSGEQERVSVIGPIPVCPSPSPTRRADGGTGACGPQPVPEQPLPKGQHIQHSINISWVHKGNLKMGRRSQKKNCDWWEAAVREKAGWFSARKHPQVALCRVGTPAARGCSCFLAPAHPQHKPGPTAEGRKLTFIEGLLWPAQ